jgi:hypothetical protein
MNISFSFFIYKSTLQKYTKRNIIQYKKANYFSLADHFIYKTEALYHRMKLFIFLFATY